MSLETALAAIDAAHAEDPRLTGPDGTPFELHYARRCTDFLDRLCPAPSPLLQIAVRAQHLRRWESPRDRYPMTRPGYHGWRTALKRRQGEACAEICRASGYADADAERVAAMIRKDDFKRDAETQTLEDVACCVFLAEALESFRTTMEEERVVKIIRKTWPKMSDAGHEVALKIEMSDACLHVVKQALAG